MCLKPVRVLGEDWMWGDTDILEPNEAGVKWHMYSDAETRVSWGRANRLRSKARMKTLLLNNNSTPMLCQTDFAAVPK